MAEAIDLTAGIDVGGTASSLATGLYWLIIIGAFAFLVWFVWRGLQYKHKFIIRALTNQGDVTIEDKLRVKKHRKTGTITWFLKKQKCKVPIAPKEAISRTSKGKYFVEAYRTVNGEYVYTTDDYLGSDNAEEAIASRYPLRNNDKEFYAQEVADGQKYKQKKTWQEVVVTLAPYMAIIVILVVFLVFFDNVVAPINDLSAQITATSENLVEGINSMKDCTQILEGDSVVQQVESPPN